MARQQDLRINGSEVCANKGVQVVCTTCATQELRYEVLFAQDGFVATDAYFDGTDNDLNQNTEFIGCCMDEPRDEVIRPQFRIWLDGNRGAV